MLAGWYVATARIAAVRQHHRGSAHRTGRGGSDLSRPKSNRAPTTAPPFAFGAAANATATPPLPPLLPPLRTPLDGIATVGLARFLYLTLDLEFQPGDLPPLVDGSAMPPFRLTETRRMRSKELHYFDHPLFGVLALITPRPAPGSSSTSPSAPGAAR